MRKLIFVSIFLALIAAIPPPALAALTNGGFETGDLTGWTPYGTVSAVGSAAGLGGTSNWSPTEGSYFAYLLTGTTANTYSLTTQDFTADAGEVLQFDVFFDTAGSIPQNQNDHGYANLTQLGLGGSTTTALYDQSVFDVGGGGADGWTHISYAFEYPGVYYITFGVEKFGSNSEQSALGVDSVRVGITPAPGAILLGSIGIALVGWLRRRRAL